MTKQPTISIKCPHCGKMVEWNKDNKHRPFCSKRCQLIDFGGWADEKHKISDKENNNS